MNTNYKPYSQNGGYGSQMNGNRSGGFGNGNNRFQNSSGYAPNRNGGGNFRTQKDNTFDFNGPKGLEKINWGAETLMPFQKDFYVPHPAVHQRSIYEIEEYRRAKEIRVENVAPNPIQNFSEGNFPDYVMNTIIKLGYESPTPIQAQGWPTALSGRDLVGIAKTGSGESNKLLYSLIFV